MMCITSVLGPQKLSFMVLQFISPFTAMYVTFETETHIWKMTETQDRELVSIGKM